MNWRMIALWGAHPYGSDVGESAYGDSGAFDWKRDWPELLGAILYPSR
jgi:hypothetical protein